MTYIFLLQSYDTPPKRPLQHTGFVTSDILSHLQSQVFKGLRRKKWFNDPHIILPSRALTHLQKRCLLQPNLRPGNGLHGWFLITPHLKVCLLIHIAGPTSSPPIPSFHQPVFLGETFQRQRTGSPHLSDNTQSSRIYGRNRRGGDPKICGNLASSRSL